MIFQQDYSQNHTIPAFLLFSIYASLFFILSIIVFLPCSSACRPDSR